MRWFSDSGTDVHVRCARERDLPGKGRVSAGPPVRATLLAALAVLATACAPATATITPTRAQPTDTAAAALATLPVKGRAPKTGYARAQFGPAWADVDRNGCDTRNDILRRDLTATTTKPGTHDCVIASGTLTDPYTGKTIPFVRGVGTSTDVQIDHVVALGDAWQKGAQQLTPAEREQLANDPLELLAVDGPANEAKRDGDAATWLPPNKAYRCAYVARQVAVKVKYRLWVTAAERDAVVRILDGCPGQPLPAGGGARG